MICVLPNLELINVIVFVATESSVGGLTVDGIDSEESCAAVFSHMIFTWGDLDFEFITMWWADVEFDRVVACIHMVSNDF